MSFARSSLVTAAAALLLSAGGSSFAAPDGSGPPYYDSQRSLEKQRDAGKAARDVARSGGPAEVAALLGDASVYVREDALKVLVERNDERLLGALDKVLAQSKRAPLAAAGVAELYGLCKYKAGRKALEQAGLRAKEEDVVLESIWALEALGDPAAAKALEKTFKRRHPNSEYRVQGDALIAIAALDPKLAEPLIKDALESRVYPLRIAGLEALSKIDPRRAAAAAVAAIKADDLAKKARGWDARILFCALDVLARWEARSADAALFKEAVDAAIARLERAEGLSQYRLAMGLKDLTGEELGDDAEIWRGWWQSRRADFAIQDKAPPAEPAKKKKGKKKDEEAKLPGEGKGEQPAGGRVETGKAARTLVRFHGIPIQSNRLLFAQDVSGGMNNPMDKDASDSPTKMAFSSGELKRVLKALDEDVWTNVCFFATEYAFTAERLFPIKRAREQLLSFVGEKAVTPSGKALGRSNLYDTLSVAFQDPEVDTVFFLSEGGPTEGQFLATDRFMQHLNRQNRYSRVQVHCLQVTTSTFGERFLRRLSEDTGGTYYDLEFLKKAHGG